jgi:hypothetical protein
MYQSVITAIRHTRNSFKGILHLAAIESGAIKTFREISNAAHVTLKYSLELADNLVDDSNRLVRNRSAATRMIDAQTDEVLPHDGSERVDHR